MSERRFQDTSNERYYGSEELHKNELFLTRYNSFIASQIYVEMDPLIHAQVVDFGAGLGTIAKLMPELVQSSLICVELDPALHSHLKLSGFKAVKSLEDITEPSNIIYSSNVLEHVEDDQAQLKEFYKCLTDKGQLILYLPALKACWSKMDEAVGHFRRYSKRDLIKKLSLAGFHVERVQYVDCIGVLASIFMRVTKINVTAASSPARSLILYDKYVFPLSKRLDSLIFKRFLGKNLLVVARKI
jgi:SAM-dependent methyltransferase